MLEDASIHRSTVVECMQWHPEKKIIAVGWRSGEVTTYNDHDHEFFEQSSIHRSPLSFLRWNQSGTQLVSGDKVRLKQGVGSGEGGGYVCKTFILLIVCIFVISSPCIRTHTHTHTHYLEWPACGVEGGQPWAASPFSPLPTSSPFSPHTLHHAPPFLLTQASRNTQSSSR